MITLEAEFIIVEERIDDELINSTNLIDAEDQEHACQKSDCTASQQCNVQRDGY